MATFTVSYTDAAGADRTSSAVTLREGTDPRLPVVLLLHGNGGTAEDMAAAGVHPGHNYDYRAPIPALVDRGRHAYPNVGVHGLALDPVKGVVSWEPALIAAGFGTACYSQTDRAGFLATPARELAAVVAELNRRLTAGRRIALLAHSRGGLLARQFLIDTAGDPAVRRRLLTLVTLHTPHQGTELAGLATALTAAVAAARALSPVSAALLSWVQDQVGAPSYQEMAVGSSYLTRLRTAESGVGAPLVPTYTFGGTSTLLSRARSWIFTPASAIPQIASVIPLRVEFHWQTLPVALPSPVTGLPPLGLLAPELQDGSGDLLVTDARSRLPGEQAHHSNDLNHAEVLWDPGVQQQVITILRRAATTDQDQDSSAPQRSYLRLYEPLAAGRP